MEIDEPPSDARALDVGGEIPLEDRTRPIFRAPFRGRDDDLGARELRDPADVILVEVREHYVGHRGRVEARAVKQFGECLVSGDVELGQTSVEPSDDAPGEVARIDDRRPILAGVEQDDPLIVLEDVDVDRERIGPAPRRQQPQYEGPPAGPDVVGANAHGAGAHDGRTADWISGHVTTLYDTSCISWSARPFG